MLATSLENLKQASGDAEKLKTIEEQLNKSNAVKLNDLHISSVDEIYFYLKSQKDGEYHLYKRVEDVLDVWVDAGSALWNCLQANEASEDEINYEHLNSQLKEWGEVAEFILEGQDQIRGWFNLLHVLSVMLRNKPAFQRCYMHGFIMDQNGEKWAKSKGNAKSPDYVVDPFGRDGLRFYVIGSTNPGLDMVFSLTAVSIKSKSLAILLNIVNFVLSMKKSADISQFLSLEGIKDTLAKSEAGKVIAEKWILSAIQSTIKRVSELFEQYKLNEVPGALEQFWVEELSHGYLQILQAREATGLYSKKDKLLLVSVLGYVLMQVSLLIAPNTPFLAEHIFQLLRSNGFTSTFGVQEESVHLCSWPTVDSELHAPSTESDYEKAKDVVYLIIKSRDLANIKIKMPLKTVCVTCSADDEKSLLLMKDIILDRTNVKTLSFDKIEAQVSILPDIGNLGRAYKNNKDKYQKSIEQNKEMIADWVAEDFKTPLQLPLPGDESFELQERFIKIERIVPSPYLMNKTDKFTIFLDSSNSPELQIEGCLREIIRYLQQQRKLAKLERSQVVPIELYVALELLHVLNDETNLSLIKERTRCHPIVSQASAFSEGAYSTSFGQIEAKFPANQ